MENENTKITKLAKIIDTIARRCWRGLPALTGDAPQPSRDDLKEAFFFRPSPDEDLGVRVQGGKEDEGREIAQEDIMIDNVDAVLAAFDWNELVQTVRRYKAEFPREWAMYTEYITLRDFRSAWGKEGACSRVAQRFDVSEFVLREIVKNVPFEIAKATTKGWGVSGGALFSGQE